MSHAWGLVLWPGPADSYRVGCFANTSTLRMSANSFSQEALERRPCQRTTCLCRSVFANSCSRAQLSGSNSVGCGYAIRFASPLSDARDAAYLRKWHASSWRHDPDRADLFDQFDTATRIVCGKADWNSRLLCGSCTKSIVGLRWARRSASRQHCQCCPNALAAALPSPTMQLSNDGLAVVPQRPLW